VAFLEDDNELRRLNAKKYNFILVKIFPLYCFIGVLLKYKKVYARIQLGNYDGKEFIFVGKRGNK